MRYRARVVNSQFSIDDRTTAAFFYRAIVSFWSLKRHAALSGASSGFLEDRDRASPPPDTSGEVESSES